MAVAEQHPVHPTIDGRRPQDAVARCPAPATGAGE